MATTGAFSDYVEDLVAKWMFKTTNMPSAPANVYLAAFTVVPTDAGGGTEVTGGSYARVAIATGSAFTETTPTTTIVNANDILFPVATANWGTVVGYALYDASSGGNQLMRFDKDSGNASISVAINTNDQLKVPAGSLSVTID
jgi:hypothetical protein